MTDAEKCRAVAEEVYRVEGNTVTTRGPVFYEFIGSLDRFDSRKKFNPLANPAQCIEALDRKFDRIWSAKRERGSAWVFGYGKQVDPVVFGHARSDDPDPVRAFCAAGVAAILAAGEAREENHG